jgi:phosphatidylglycerophosphatase A
MILHDKTALFLATGCFVGKIPIAPGTLGSLAGLPLCYALSLAPLPVAFTLIAVLTAMAIHVAGAAEKALGQKDPGCIVIDEIAGMAVTLFGLPFSPVIVITGFFLFRVLDVLKPPPVSTMEKRFAGGAGIVLDDIVAGCMANLLLRLLLYITPGFV